MDNNGDGLLERFLRVHGVELDDEVIPYIDNYLDQVQPLIADEQFLEHIAYTLGMPPNFFGNATQYRTLLWVIVSIYKIKGTEPALNALFALIGLQVQIVPIYTDCLRYDTRPLIYDDPANLYDSCCKKCIRYRLEWGQFQSCQNPVIPVVIGESLTPELQATIEALLCFLMPLHSNLEGLTEAFFVCDQTNLKIGETIMVRMSEGTYYDTGEVYDDAIIYDQYTLITSYYL